MTKKRHFLSPLNILLLLILIVSIFLRFYNLKDSLMFQGDQGRDALVVANIFKNHDPVFIGPVTSIGNMYLGPFYYYFMLPFLRLTYPSPMGPVYAVAAVGVLTVILFYFLMQKIFGRHSVLLATVFLALSHTAVNLSRFSWNPNLAPFFSLLMFYFTYLAWKKDERYWLLVSAMFSVLIQLHYVTLLAGLGSGLIYLISLKEKIKAKKAKKIFSNGLLALLIFILSLTPLILFDIKHQGVNLTALGNIFTKENSFDLQNQTSNIFSALSQLLIHELPNKASQIIWQTSFGDLSINHYFLYLSGIIVLIYLLKKKPKLKDGEILLFSYLGTGLLGLSLYQHPVYAHYFAYLLPMVYLFYAWLLKQIKAKWLLYPLLVAFVGFYIWRNQQLYNLADSGWTIDQMQEVTDSIYQRTTDDQAYNIVLLSESKDLYGMNYRYFLSTTDHPPLTMENHHQAEQLFIIDEQKQGKAVIDLPIYELVVFEPKNIVDHYQFDPGPEITVLAKSETPYND